MESGSLMRSADAERDSGGPCASRPVSIGPAPRRFQRAPEQAAPGV